MENCRTAVAAADERLDSDSKDAETAGVTTGTYAYYQWWDWARNLSPFQN